MQKAGGSTVGSVPLGAAQCDEIRTHLETVAASAAFASSPRLTLLLRYLVERTLAGEGDQINEYAIGQDVFDKTASFDPRIESIVRTQTGRLRQKLKGYYSDVNAGRDDRLMIDLPLYSYIPALIVRESEPASAPIVTPEAPAPAARSRWLWITLIAGVALAMLGSGYAIWRAGNQASVHGYPFQPLLPSGAVRVNGACAFGNCDAGDILDDQESASKPFDFTTQMPNGDRYRIEGTLSTRNAGGYFIHAARKVTYLGNPSGAPSGADTLTVDFIQRYAVLHPSGGSTFTEGTIEIFGGPISPLSTARYQNIYNGNKLPLLGPFSPPKGKGSASQRIAGIQQTVMLTSRHIYAFAAGSGVGANIGAN